MISVSLRKVLLSAAAAMALMTAATTAEATNYKYTIPVCVVSSGTGYALKLGRDENDKTCSMAGGTSDGAIRVKNGDHHEITFELQPPYQGYDWYHAALPVMIGPNQTPNACGNGVSPGADFKAFSLDLPTSAKPYSLVFHDNNSASKGCFKYSLSVDIDKAARPTRSSKAATRKPITLDPIIVND